MTLEVWTKRNHKVPMPGVEVKGPREDGTGGNL